MYKRSNKISFWALGLSILAIVLCLIIIALWFFKTEDFSVVDSNTFIAVIVALLAILVTLVLGWQIYNAIDINRKINDFMSMKTRIMVIDDDLTHLYNKTTHIQYFTLGDIAAGKGKYRDAFCYYIGSLAASLKMSQPMNVETILEELESTLKNIVKEDVLETELNRELQYNDKDIRKSRTYSCIKHRYEKLFHTYQFITEEK